MIDRWGGGVGGCRLGLVAAGGVGRKEGGGSYMTMMICPLLGFIQKRKTS